MSHSLSRLPGGLRVVHSEMPSMHSVAVAIFVGIGSRYEQARHAGAAHLIEHMLFKGTDRRPRPSDISETLDAVGGILNASTEKEATVYWAKTAREHLPLAVDLLADMLRNSRLRPSDLVREKGVILEELSMLADDPEDWVHVVADELLWPRQPAGREIAGTRETVSTLRRRDLTAYLGTYYGPNNVVMSIAGGVGHQEAIDLIQTAFACWPEVTMPAAEPALIPSGAPRARLEYKPIEQVHMCLTFPTIPRNHVDRWALDMLCTVLGGGASSRLFVQLREKFGLAYDIQSYTTQLADTGALVAYAAADPSKSQRVLVEIWRVIDRLTQRRISDRELTNAKQYFRGRLFLGLEDTQAVAAWYGAQELLEGKMIGPDAAADAVDEVTTGDVLRVARAYLHAGESRLAAVGPVGGLGLESQLVGA